MQQLQRVIQHRIPAQYIHTVTEDENDLIDFRVHRVVFVSAPVHLFPNQGAKQVLMIPRYLQGFVLTICSRLIIYPQYSFTTPCFSGMRPSPVSQTIKSSEILPRIQRSLHGLVY